MFDHSSRPVIMGGGCGLKADFSVLLLKDGVAATGVLVVEELFITWLIQGLSLRSTLPVELKTGRQERRSTSLSRTSTFKG